MLVSSGALVIAGREFKSRLILGTGKFSSPEVMREALTKGLGYDVTTPYADFVGRLAGAMPR
jgi:thiazole synthase ThiGH ThiG subunit